MAAEGEGGLLVGARRAPEAEIDPSRMKGREDAERLRDVERRVQKAERDVAEKPLPDLDRPVGAPAAYADHARLMFDLQVLALQGDVTRVITFQLARETSNRTYPEIGVPDPHHPLSHHGNDPAKIARMAKINQFHVSLFAEYVGKLNFYVQLVDDKMRDHTLDQATLGILLVVDRDDVTVEVALRGISTPLAVSEWRRLPSEVRRALPSAEDLTETVTRTVREIESAVLQSDLILPASVRRGRNALSLRFPAFLERLDSITAAMQDEGRRAHLPQQVRNVEPV